MLEVPRSRLKRLRNVRRLGLKDVKLECPPTTNMKVPNSEH